METLHRYWPDPLSELTKAHSAVSQRAGAESAYERPSASTASSRQLRGGFPQSAAEAEGVQLRPPFCVAGAGCVDSQASFMVFADDKADWLD